MVEYLLDECKCVCESLTERVVDVAQKSEVMTTLEILEVIFIVLIVVVMILGLVFAFNKLKGDEDEPPSYY